MKIQACIAGCLLGSAVVVGAQAPRATDAVRTAVSSAEIQATLAAFDVDRTSGKAPRRFRFAVSRRHSEHRRPTED